MDNPQNQAAFSHSTEAIFAKILDFYGIAWEYEPRTFVLEWDEQCNPLVAFTPDFYLPDQDLYIELTTLRPKLSTHKNRKIRQMKALYPEIHIKLYKRKEMRELMLKFGLLDEAAPILNGQAQSEDNGATG